MDQPKEFEFNEFVPELLKLQFNLFQKNSELTEALGNFLNFIEENSGKIKEQLTQLNEKNYFTPAGDAVINLPGLIPPFRYENRQRIAEIANNTALIIQALSAVENSRVPRIKYE